MIAFILIFIIKNRSCFQGKIDAWSCISNADFFEFATHIHPSFNCPIDFISKSLPRLQLLKRMRNFCKKLSHAIPASITWSLILGCTGAFFYLLVPAFIEIYGYTGWILCGTDCIIFILLLSNLFMAMSMDPGVHPLGNNPFLGGLLHHVNLFYSFIRRRSNDGWFSITFI